MRRSSAGIDENHEKRKRLGLVMLLNEWHAFAGTALGVLSLVMVVTGITRSQ